MSTSVVFQQMLIIIILIIIGYGIYKKGFVGDEGAKNISFLVLNVTNPAYVISSAFSDDISITHEDILFAIVLTFIIYGVLIAFGHILPYIIGVEKAKRKFHAMLSVYSNVGFIGIPVASAVLGQESLIYVTLFNVVYTIFFYTHGYIYLLKDVEGADNRISIKSFINIGTISSVITIIVFWFNIRFPMVIEDTLTYTGRATTFLAMMVLGFSFAKIPFRKILGDPKVYLMVAIRYIAFPVAGTVLLKTLLGDTLLVHTCALMLAMPAGNSPLMLAASYDMETDTMSSGILISTVVSLLSVTLTSMVL